MPTYGAFGAWASGVASASVTAYKAESGRTVTATDGSAAGTSNSFTVAPGPLDKFTIATIAGQIAGAAFNVTATAYDEWDNVSRRTMHGRRDAVRDAVELHAGLQDRQCLAMLAHLRQLWHLGRRCRERVRNRVQGRDEPNRDGHRQRQDRH